MCISINNPPFAHKHRRALSYARHSLYNECGTQCRSGGLVHLTVARVYLEMGGFSRALEGLQASHKIAAGIGDPALQLQVYVSLSELFGRLQDADKSARYASKAYDLSRSLQVRGVLEVGVKWVLPFNLITICTCLAW